MVSDKETIMGKLTFEVKRKIIQVAAFGYSNLYLGNFLDGRLYKMAQPDFRMEVIMYGG